MAERYKLIACRVFARSLERIIAASSRDIDLVLLPQEAHRESTELRRVVGEAMAEAEAAGEYDAILLAYGLCGNGVSGLGADKSPLVIPRAHDCCTLFLGSRGRFAEHFRDNPSRPFSSPGYLAEGDNSFHESTVEEFLGDGRSWEDLVAEYGEENARYVRETLGASTPGRDRVVYIRDPEENPPELEEKVRRDAEAEGLAFLPLEGSDRLLEKLVNGPWDEEFLVASPGETIRPVYDWEEILRAEP